MIRIFSKLVLCLIFVTGPISCAQISSVRFLEIASSEPKPTLERSSLVEPGWRVELLQSAGGNWSCFTQPARGLELMLWRNGTDLLEVKLEDNELLGSRLVIPSFVVTECFLNTKFHLVAEHGVLNVLTAALSLYRMGRANLESSSMQLREYFEWIQKYTGDVC